MHEYSLMEDVVGAILDSLKREGVTQQGAVKEVKLKVGALDIHSSESFAQAFTSLTQGTLLEGARLDLEIVPARITCAKCGHSGDIGVGEADGHQAEPVVECPQCGEPCVVTGGRGIHPIDIIIED
ncbi:MAG: hydrogenase maturation nickel metallochaperone HypA [Candidatus Sumerlaea chitinivorans]|nr:hydrogenase maturation nickel metallochaperone HypA [Candidatus Sumerlaea chitinivorans]